MGRTWTLERSLFALAGTMTLLSAALAALVSPWFLLLTAFVGVNQWLYVVVGACPACPTVSTRLFAPVANRASADARRRTRVKRQYTTATTTTNMLTRNEPDMGTSWIDLARVIRR